MPQKHIQPSHRENHWSKSRPTARQTSRHTHSHVKQEANLGFDDQDADDDGNETNGPLFLWEEEATLLSDLMEEEPPQTADQQYDALVESLNDPFLNESKRLKKEIASTFVPVANRIKAVYQTLDQQVNKAYGQGIVQFNKACTDIEETMSIKQSKSLEAYQATKEKTDDLFERLKNEYAVRDQMWVDVKKAVDEIVALAIEQLKDTPASIERTIAKLEKKSESLGKHDNDMSSLANELWKKII